MKKNKTISELRLLSMWLLDQDFYTKNLYYSKDIEDMKYHGFFC